MKVRYGPKEEVMNYLVCVNDAVVPKTSMEGTGVFPPPTGWGVNEMLFHVLISCTPLLSDK